MYRSTLPREVGDDHALSIAAITAGVTLRSLRTRSTLGLYGIGADRILTHLESNSVFVYSECDDNEYDLISMPHCNNSLS